MNKSVITALGSFGENRWNPIKTELDNPESLIIK
uniref:Uncharacterized protein n=1 Tax=Anguilla anguilla TaxID=7936 RepID=A0A0E9RHC4_ANGAN